MDISPHPEGPPGVISIVYVCACQQPFFRKTTIGQIQDSDPKNGRSVNLFTRRTITSWLIYAYLKRVHTAVIVPLHAPGTTHSAIGRS